MILTSPAFQNNSLLPIKYTADGDGINPPFKIAETPTNAQSLVLVCDDPDAPGGSFIHWTIWNINPRTSEILERSVPQGGIQGATSTGRIGFMPPAPPSGQHRYIFKIFALDSTLQLAPTSNIQQLQAAMQNHVLAQTELIGLYQHKQ